MAEVEERSVAVWQGKIQAKVKVAGSGPPLVFFHGAGGLAWDGFLDSLALSHTVYAPHHPGTTEDDPDAIQHLDDLWDLALFYDEVFDALGLDSVSLVGHSFGGMVACEVAATNPQRVDKLVLLDPIGLWRDDIPIKNWMVMPLTELMSLVLSNPAGEAARQMFAMPEDPEARVMAQAQFVWALACTGKFVWPIPDKGLKKRLHRIVAPTLILWGRDDRLVPPAYAQEFASRIVNSRAEMVEKAGHIPHSEQAEAVSAAVLDFLRQ